MALMHFVNFNMTCLTIILFDRLGEVITMYRNIVEVRDPGSALVPIEFQLSKL